MLLEIILRDANATTVRVTSPSAILANSTSVPPCAITLGTVDLGKGITSTRGFFPFLRNAIDRKKLDNLIR